MHIPWHKIIAHRGWNRTWNWMFTVWTASFSGPDYSTASWPCYRASVNCVLIGPPKQQSGDPHLPLKTMSSSRFPCTYERQVYIIMCALYWVMADINIYLVLLWPVHAINLCCIVVGPSYTMSAQHKSNIASVSFMCVIVDLLLCKTNIPAACAQWW